MHFKNLVGVKIKRVAHHLPGRPLSNQDIIDRYKIRLKSEWVEFNIGIKSRHWCEGHELTSDLATIVGKKLIENFPEDKIGGLILSTVSPDVMTPSTAAITQSKLTPGMTYPSFDIVAACSGFLFGLDSARRFVQTGTDNMLCIASEIRSYYINKEDRRTVMLFADGAAGALFSKCEKDEVGIIYSETFTDGRFWDAVSVEGKGTKSFLEGASPNNYIVMKDASLIFQKATEKMEELIRHGLKACKLEISDIQYFIFHQASAVILKKMTESLGIPEDKYHLNFDRVGNTSSASVPIALSEAYEQKKFKKGDLICLMATGGGFGAAITILRWEGDE